MVCRGCLSTGIGITGAVRPGYDLAPGEEVADRFCQSVSIDILTVEPHHQSGYRVRVGALLGHSDGEGLGGSGIVIGIAWLAHGDGSCAHTFGFEVDTVYIDHCGIGTGVGQGKPGIRTTSIHGLNCGREGEVSIILSQVG